MPNYTNIGKFRVDRDHVLGRGNYGKVYLGEDLKAKGYQVAAKEIYLGNNKAVVQVCYIFFHQPSKYHLY